MADILLFHHAFGLTPGLRAFAGRLTAAGHAVYTTDMYDGRVASTLDEGMAVLDTVDMATQQEKARAASREHPYADVVIGFSCGAYPAQVLATENPLIQGCLLVGSVIPPGYLSEPWRPDLPLEIHAADPDPWLEDEELDALTAEVPDAVVWRYPGLGHLFMDVSTPDYDAEGAALFEARVLAWLGGSSADAFDAFP